MFEVVTFDISVATTYSDLDPLCQIHFILEVNAFSSNFLKIEHFRLCTNNHCFLIRRCWISNNRDVKFVEDFGSQN